METIKIENVERKLHVGLGHFRQEKNQYASMCELWDKNNVIGKGNILWLT